MITPNYKGFLLSGIQRNNLYSGRVKNSRSFTLGIEESSTFQYDTSWEDENDKDLEVR